jgi:hypothetical protein
MIVAGDMVRLVNTPRKESERFVGRVGLVHNCGADNLFEVKFYNEDGKFGFLPEHLRWEGVMANEAMVEKVAL